MADGQPINRLQVAGEHLPGGSGLQLGAGSRLLPAYTPGRASKMATTLRG